MVGIDNVKKLTKVVVMLANAVDKSTKDGLSFEDAGNFIPVLMELPGALAGYAQLGAELKDLDAQELVELKELAKAELNIVDKDLEAVIKLALTVIGDIYNLYTEIKALRA